MRGDAKTSVAGLAARFDLACIKFECGGGCLPPSRWHDADCEVRLIREVV